MGVDVYRIADHKSIEGWLEFHERIRGERDWRKVGEARNIVLNQFYVDLFNLQDGLVPGTVDFTIKAMALGIGTTAPARTDAGLAHEWFGNEVAVLTGAGLASGTTTSIPLAFPLAEALVSGNVITVGTNTPTVAAAGAAVGATSIPVNSFTATTTAAFAPITFASAGTTAQRMSPTNYSPSATDPPSNIMSFYLAAGANSSPFTFQEAGLLYNNPSLAAGGAGTFLTHALFTYAKAANTDLRIDYTLQRTAT